MKAWGYGKGYEYAHDNEEKIAGMECLPERLRGRRYYAPTEEGFEKRMGERLEQIKKTRESLRNNDR